MKRIDILCSSPGSTAICSSIDQRSMIRRSQKPILDTTQQTPRTRTTHFDPKHYSPSIPCSSQLPINPKPYNHFEKSRKSTSSNIYSTSKYNINQQVRRKSSADILDLKSHHRHESSSRYLLGESRSSFVLEWLPESNGKTTEKRVGSKIVVADSESEKAKFRSLSCNGSSGLIKSSSTNCRSRHQVVVLRVSLHCKGCEGKVRKHLSKMEGVTSFSIDMATKKVTVIGDVTPLGVLASVSKVKNAQLWPSSSSPSSPWSS